MKSKKLKVISVLAMVVSFAIPQQALAAAPVVDDLAGSEVYTVSPRWTNIMAANPLISSSGKTVSSGAYIKATSTSHKITGTYTLQKKVGSSWSSVDSWSISGTGVASESETYSGTSGTTYRTKLSTTVNGETTTVYSKSITL